MYTGNYMHYFSVWRHGNDIMQGQRVAPFSMPNFCAICGTTKKIHIHHIMPNRISHDQNKENLIPLCASCHPKIERVTRDFLKAFDGEYEKAEPLLRMILRQRQYATSLVIKEILNGNSKNKD